MKGCRRSSRAPRRELTPLRALLASFLLLSSCDFSGRTPQPAPGPSAEESPKLAAAPTTIAGLRERATREFERAWQLGPHPESDVGFDRYLAPLLLFEEPFGAGGAGTGLQSGGESETESGTETESARLSPIGALVRVPGGWAMDRSRPRVYFESGTREIRGSTYDTLAFLWFQPASVTAASSSGWLIADPRAQGLRVTFGDGAFPALIELLDDSSGFRILAVAERFEEAARDEFGQPVAEGASACEALAPGLEPRPALLRRFPVGPVPMGPWVYLESSRGDIATVLCRCEPSQVSSMTGGGFYELRPLGDLREVGLSGAAWSPRLLLDAPTGAGESGEPDEMWLERALRFPERF